MVYFGFIREGIDMKTLRIVNSRNECTYVERLFFRRWWVVLLRSIRVTLRRITGFAGRGMLNL